MPAMVQYWMRFLIRHKDTLLLALAACCLLVAASRPTLSIQRETHTYFLIVDITQSMNTQDMRLYGKPVSRLQYTQHLLHQLIASMPCQSRVSIGLFAGDTVAALYTPLEICTHYPEIQSTITHLDWRMAWSGNSRLRESLLVSASLVHSMPASTQVVYLTDGEEAPLLHAFNTHTLEGLHAGKNWLLVGMGSEKGAAIPKLDSNNQVIGYWSNESFAVQPNVAQISASKRGGRDDSVAFSEQDRYLSHRASRYLQALAHEMGARYIEGDSVSAVLDTMQSQPGAQRHTTAMEMDWLPALIAIGCLLATYHHTGNLRALKRHWQRKQHRHSPVQANEHRMLQ